MTEYAPKHDGERDPVDPGLPLDSHTSLLDSFYAPAQAGRWGLARECFAAALECSSKKALTAGTASPQKLAQYIGALHLEDLALATACAEGVEAAWEHF